MFRTQLNKMTQQPHERFEILVLFLLSCLVDLIAKTLDPDVAIMHIAESSLHSRHTFRISCKRTPPALLKQLYRVTQPFRCNTHLVQSLDFKGAKQSITQFFQLFQTIENYRSRHLAKTDWQ